MQSFFLHIKNSHKSNIHLLWYFKSNWFLLLSPHLPSSFCYRNSVTTVRGRHTHYTLGDQFKNFFTSKMNRERERGWNNEQERDDDEYRGKSKRVAKSNDLSISLTLFILSLSLSFFESWRKTFSLFLEPTKLFSPLKSKSFQVSSKSLLLA